MHAYNYPKLDSIEPKAHAKNCLGIKNNVVHKLLLQVHSIIVKLLNSKTLSSSWEDSYHLELIMNR